jgi:hypothetical protein
LAVAVEVERRETWKRRWSSHLVTELEEEMICERASFVVEVRERCAVVRSK